MSFGTDTAPSVSFVMATERASSRMHAKEHRRILAWVVGSSYGLGLALAKILRREGVDLVMFSSNPTALFLAYKDVCAQEGVGNVDMAVLDLNNHKEIQHVVSEKLSDGGTPDEVYIMPGISEPGPFLTTGPESLRRMMDLNFFGQVETVRAILPTMIKSGRGRILTCASLLGCFTMPGFAGYSASKHALVSFSRSMRAELRGSGVQMSCLCPPAMSTPGFEKEIAISTPALIQVQEGLKVLEPTSVGEFTIRKLRKGKFLIVPGFDSQLVLLLARHFPIILDLIVSRRTRSVSFF